MSPDEMREQTETYDLGAECSSTQKAFELLQSHIVHNGRVVILADGNTEPLVLTPDFHRKELTLYGSSDGWNYAKHARWFFDVVRRSPKPIETLFDVTISPHEISHTFEALSSQTLIAIKVFITDFR